MSWLHSFLLVFGLVFMLSVQHVDGMTEPELQTNLGSCNCCKDEQIWKNVAYMKSLITWLRSKMADVGSEVVRYQNLNYLESFEYKYLFYKSKYEPEPKHEKD